jgi:hypothetical protein
MVVQGRSAPPSPPHRPSVSHHVSDAAAGLERESGKQWAASHSMRGTVCGEALGLDSE